LKRPGKESGFEATIKKWRFLMVSGVQEKSGSSAFDWIQFIARA